MPESKSQQFIFALMMAFAMVGLMASYNVFYRMGFSVEALQVWFIKALKEYICAVPIAFFFGSICSGALAKTYTPANKMKFFPYFMSFFTVLIMLPIMTVVVALLDGFFTLPLNELFGRMRFNAYFALPIQLLVAGPLVRYLFSKLKPHLK